MCRARYISNEISMTSPQKRDSMRDIGKEIDLRKEIVERRRKRIV